ncbi:MAG: hypothetical protein M1827_002894 [Pycnora praestabilis]|nr:MAG: hypothetical protein M1827_002894 [Pycnora praestabilis]
MSTTIDQGSSGAQKLYDELLQYFKAHSSKVVQIEVLPSNFPVISETGSSILQDGLSLGIPKKALLQAFVVARKIFFNGLNRDLRSSEHDESTFDATKVILLLDPEHITGANFRKRRLLALLSASRTDRKQDTGAILQQELAFLESLLTSPLHRHTKSPTLWHHRLWVIQGCFPNVCSPQSSGQDFDRKDVSGSQIVGFYKNEIKIVMKAGEKHPKNYYAWNYARKLLEILWHMTSALGEHNFVPDLYEGHIVQQVHSWCTLHPSDISGWSFVLFLMRGWKYSHISGNTIWLRMTHVYQSLVRKTIDVSFDFRWQHESVWVFIRTVLASNVYLSLSTRNAFIEELRKRIQPTDQTVSTALKEGEALRNSLDGFTRLSRGTTREALLWIESNWED